jgi:uncharacterized protein
MPGPVAAILGDGRLHLQHGPIDLIIGLDTACVADRQRTFGAAVDRFGSVLDELVGELRLLRSAVTPGSPEPIGDIARRMDRAVRPFARQHFVTRMAAVAGAVADEVLAAITNQAPLSRAYVNNGGDIALHLPVCTSYRAAIAGLDGAGLGRITIDAATGARGIATSGQGGRSLSLGIADSVTVLARNAAAADAAATLIANAVDLPGHCNVRRTPAHDIDPDSDLGARRVVTDVGALTGGEVAVALAAGENAARAMLDCDLILGAALFLRRDRRIVGALPLPPKVQTEMVYHA